MLNIVIAFALSYPTWASAKFEDFSSLALMGATVLKVSCSPAGAGRVWVVRDEYNFSEHVGVAEVPVADAECEKLIRRTRAALGCYGHARIDLFIDHPNPDSAVVVDCGFARNEGPCAGPPTAK